MTAAMSWELDDEHEEFRASVRGFVDRHAIYLPNAIEAFTAVHACNRIGAIYTILFSGFGPGKPVPPGTKGNLVLTQPFPTLARTVWDDPDRYRHAYFSRFHGCYCTNDEAVLDEDGHLWVLGGYARLGVVEHGEPRGDTSAMEDVSGLQAVQQAVAAASGT
jgi:acyl-coenzyme A synthetase/AMP-(fatty) acid ligase